MDDVVDVAIEAPVANVAFAMNPAEAVTGIIDWTTSIGMDINKRAPKPLDTLKYNGKPDGLLLFLKMFKNRGSEFGWFSLYRTPAIAMIAEDPDNPDSEVYDFIKYYGSISRAEVEKHASRYLFNEEEPGCLRARQDDSLAYRCLMNSLDQGMLRVVLLKESKYHLADPGNENENVPSAILFLKTIIEECSIQTNATTSTIRTRLASLAEYMKQIGSDIPKFNQYVEENINALAARSEESTDVLVNLWKAYKKVEDKQFADFIKRQCESYELSNREITPKTLMNLALNKYRLMKEAGEWKEPSEEEKVIMALKAEIKGLKNPKKKQKEEPKKRTAKHKHGQDRKGKGKPSSKPDDLKNHVPPSDVKKTVTWNNNTYHWCSEDTGGKCGGKWRTHKPAECKGIEFLKRQHDGHGDNEKKSNKSPILKAVAALAGDTSDSDAMEE